MWRTAKQILFCRTKRGKIRTPALMSESRTTYTLYTLERQTSTVSLASLFSRFLYGGCFCCGLTETQERICSERSGALRCLSQNRERREALTASQPLPNQSLMDVCNILNRLKWFVGCIFFWHYLFGSVNFTCT